MPQQTKLRAFPYYTTPISHLSFTRSILALSGMPLTPRAVEEKDLLDDSIKRAFILPLVATSAAVIAS